MKKGWMVASLMLMGAQALAAPKLAKPADSFVDSIGVSTHVGNSVLVGGNAYADPRILGELGSLGVRHIRDHSYNDEAIAIIDTLKNTYNIHANLILGETTRSPAQLQSIL